MLLLNWLGPRLLDSQVAASADKYPKSQTVDYVVRELITTKVAKFFCYGSNHALDRSKRTARKGL